MSLLKWDGQTLVTSEERSTADIAIAPETDIALTPPALDGAQIVALSFPSLKDGRAFTQARVLREQGFSGDIRATGALFADQLSFAIRCGFTSFDLDSALDPAVAARSLGRFKQPYQRGASGTPAWEVR